MTKENPFEKTVSYSYPQAKPLPTENKQEKDVEKWEEEANAYLRHHDIPKRVIDIGKGQEVYNSFWHNFLIIFFLLAIVAFMAFAGWGIYNDKFKTVFNDNSTVVCEAVEIPECPTAPDCPACPSLNCGNVTVQIPENLQITLKNNLTGGNESG